MLKIEPFSLKNRDAVIVKNTRNYSVVNSNSTIIITNCTGIIITKSSNITTTIINGVVINLNDSATKINENSYIRVLKIMKSEKYWCLK